MKTGAIFMKTLIYAVMGLFTVECLALNKNNNAEQQQWQQFVNRYSKQVETKLKEKSIPGAALSIVQGDDSYFQKGFGRTKVKQGRKVDAHTRFRLASVSKTFAGSLTAKLATEGKIDLDREISHYLPQARESKFENLKVYNLLSHSSGIVPNAYDNLVESRMSYIDITDKLFDIQPICKPSICYGYQNVMFSLIDRVIQAKTGLDYKTWVEEFLFAPLGMRDGGVGLKNLTKDNNFAAPHVLGRKRWHTARLKSNYYKVLPAAGINASAADMVFWLKAQLGHFPGVLSLDALTVQSRPYVQTKRELKRRIWRKHVKEAHYGLGWRIYDFEGTLLFYHSGWVQGYRTDIVVIPSMNIGYSMLLNAESGLINELTVEFIKQAIEWKETSTANAVDEEA